MRSGPPSSNRRRRLPEDGTLEVFAADEQSAEPVEVHRWTKLAEDVLRAQGVRGEAELSLLFVTEEAIGDLNQRFMETSGPTDVLAFPIDDDLIELGRFPDTTTTGPDRPPPDPSDAPVLLGDVVICPQVVADEWRWPLVHGILHLLGLEHGDEMERRERVILGAAE